MWCLVLHKVATVLIGFTLQSIVELGVGTAGGPKRIRKEGQLPRAQHPPNWGTRFRHHSEDEDLEVSIEVIVIYLVAVGELVHQGLGWNPASNPEAGGCSLEGESTRGERQGNQASIGTKTRCYTRRRMHATDGI